MSLRLLGKNTVIYAIGNVGARAAALLLVPLYAHALSMSDFGLLMTLQLTMQFMLAVMNCGMRHSLVRFARRYEQDDRISELLGTSCLINVLAGLVVTSISLTLLVPFFRSVFHSQDVHTFVGMACCISLLRSLGTHIMSYYRARNQALKFMILGIATAGILFLATYVSLRVLYLRITGALLAMIVTYTITLLFMSIDIIRKTRISVSSALVPKLMRFGLPLFLASTGELVVGGASIYFLSHYSGLEPVAVYSLGNKLAGILLIAVIFPFQLSFKPFVFDNLDTLHIRKQMARLLTYLVLAVSLCSFGILLCARFFLPLIAPPEYSSAYIAILLVLPRIMFVGIYYFAQTLLGAVEKTHIVGLTVSVCAILSIVLNYILIPMLSWYGAIITVNVSFVAIASTLLIVGMKKFPVPIEWGRLGAAVALFLAVILLNAGLIAVDNRTYYGVSAIAICAIGYFLYVSPLYDEREKMLVREGIQKVKTLFAYHSKCDGNMRGVTLDERRKP